MQSLVSTALGLDDLRERADFERVISLNEAAKELIARSFRVNLLALDAMVQSKRGGSSLRGFEAFISAGWGRATRVTPGAHVCPAWTSK